MDYSYHIIKPVGLGFALHPYELRQYFIHTMIGRNIYSLIAWKMTGKNPYFYHRNKNQEIKKKNQQ